MLEYYANYKHPVTVEAVLKEFADKDVRLVEIAYLQVMMVRAADDPIKSVNYFKPAIEDIYAGFEKVRSRQMSISSATIGVVLEARRRQAKKAAIIS